MNSKFSERLERLHRVMELDAPSLILAELWLMLEKVVETPEHKEVLDSTKRQLELVEGFQEGLTRVHRIKSLQDAGYCTYPKLGAPEDLCKEPVVPGEMFCSDCCAVSDADAGADDALTPEERKQIDADCKDLSRIGPR